METTEEASDILLWTIKHGRASVGRPARTYLYLLRTDTGCNLEDLLWAMVDRDGWRERVKGIRAVSRTWWWRSTLVTSFKHLESLVFPNFLHHFKKPKRLCKRVLATKSSTENKKNYYLLQVIPTNYHIYKLIDITYSIELLNSLELPKNFPYKLDLKVGAPEGSYLPSKRNTPKSERIENALLISTEQF